MARISSYNLDTTVSKTDKVIGTDSSGNTTKNFNMKNMADFLNTSSLINVNGQIIYKFLADQSSTLAGTFVISGGGADGTNLSSITHLIFHHLRQIRQWIHHMQYLGCTQPVHYYCFHSKQTSLYHQY